MFCHKCGSKLPEEAAFCSKCGTKTVTPTVSPVSISKQNLSIKRKTKWMVGLVAFVCVVVVIIVAVNFNGDSGDDYNSNSYPSYSASTQSSNSSESSFAWVEEAQMITEDDFITSRYIVGSIKNISDMTFRSASVEFALYDSSGNQIGTAYDFISNFRAGNVWKFKAGVLSDDVVYFEFTQATKTY